MRHAFLTQFPSLAGVALDPPGAEATFGKCVIDWSERATNAWAVRLHRDLIALRRDEHPAYGGDGVREPIDSDGSWYVQGRAAFVLAGDR